MQRVFDILLFVLVIIVVVYLFGAAGILDFPTHRT